MNISLTPELEAFVNSKVASGMYQTASEVVREGLRLLHEQEELQQTKLRELRREITIGIDQADRGKLAALNAKETLARVRTNRISRNQQGR